MKDVIQVADTGFHPRRQYLLLSSQCPLLVIPVPRHWDGFVASLAMMDKDKKDGEYQ
ncbi:hypothetical protein [Wolbachia endosymbiont (group A) of Pogonocherus hispidulus]|uniref:hypothetical protein n=1 Tax=Wolbachia endosymbiont (group A) of Pogonocherus hispidulus TaxID=3066136 RepID=UPI003340FB4E